MVSRDCPIFYRRKKAQKDMAEAKVQLDRWKSWSLEQILHCEDTKSQVTFWGWLNCGYEVICIYRSVQTRLVFEQMEADDVSFLFFRWSYVGFFVSANKLVDKEKQPKIITVERAAIIKPLPLRPSWERSYYWERWCELFGYFFCRYSCFYSMGISLFLC